MINRLCKWCGSDKHTSFACFKKPRKPIKRQSVKTKAKHLAVRAEWFELNPADAQGQWECYLRISPLCLVKVDISTLNQEHVKGKARHPELRYVVENIKASCQFCNDHKRSLDIADLVDEFPHLRQYL